MSLAFSIATTQLLGAFIDGWTTLRPTWAHATQTSMPPKAFAIPATAWIKLVVSFNEGRNRSIPIRDEVGGLFTVDVYAPFDERDTSTMFAENALLDDAHAVLRSMDLASDIHDVRIDVQTLPITEEAHQHKRLALHFRFDLPRV